MSEPYEAVQPFLDRISNVIDAIFWFMLAVSIIMVAYAVNKLRDSTV